MEGFIFITYCGSINTIAVSFLLKFIPTSPYFYLFCLLFKTNSYVLCIHNNFKTINLQLGTFK